MEQDTLQPITIRFPQDLRDRIQRMADLDDRSFSSMVIRLLRKSTQRFATVEQKPAAQEEVAPNS